MKTFHSALILTALTALFPILSSAQTSSAPVIATQPISLTAQAGAAATFSVVATGSPTPNYQWYKDGFPVFGANSASYIITSASAADAAAYSVRVSNSAGSVTSNPATLSVAIQPSVVTAGPQSQTVNAGTDVTLSVTATGTGLTYRWEHNGRRIAAATGATLTLANAGSDAAGLYTVAVANATGVAAVEAAELTVVTNARLTNISTRGFVGTDSDQVLIAGFVINGTGTKQVLLRGVGPTLASQFSVTGALTNPELTLYNRDGDTLATNSVWGGGTALTSAFTQVGAFSLPANSADSALLESLGPGAFTAHVTGPNSGTGIALVELYDADTGTPPARFVNISARAFVANGGKVLIAGFVITGTTSETVLIRGVGPSMGTLFGFRRALGDSRVTLFDSKGNQIATNAQWDDDDDEGAEKTDMDHRVGAFDLEHHTHDSALLVTLAPGAYTAQVSGVGNSTGVALAEVYEVR